MADVREELIRAARSNLTPDDTKADVLEMLRQKADDIDPRDIATCARCGVEVTPETPSAFYPEHDHRCGGLLEEPQPADVSPAETHHQEADHG